MQAHTSLQLTNLAIAYITSELPEYGFVTALKAVRCAEERGEPLQLRRALNIASACCVISGDYVNAIDYGLRATAQARELGHDDAMINALINVTHALIQLGFYEESIDIAARVTYRFRDQDHCAHDLQKLIINGANACLASDRYVEAMQFCQEAAAIDEKVDGQCCVSTQIRSELVWMKAAIALDYANVVSERFKMIRCLVLRHPTLERQCQLRFAEALFRNYAEADIAFALRELESLVVLAQGMSDLQGEAIKGLVSLCHEMGDAAKAAHYQRIRAEHARVEQTKRIERAMAVSGADNPVGRDINVFAIQQYVEQLFESEPSSHYDCRRIAVRLPRAKHLALERIALSGKVADDLTGQSIYRVGSMTAILAKALGHDEPTAYSFELAARLHPIGRVSNVGLASFDIDKNARLAQWHYSSLGSELLLANGDEAFLKLASDVVHNQHEHWDGTGGPRGLTRQEIPEPARIMAVALAYDQLTHQGTLSHVEAVHRIKADSGSRFDPDIVLCFLPTVERLHLQHGHQLDQFLSESAPARREAKQARELLRDLVPDLTILEC